MKVYLLALCTVLSSCTPVVQPRHRLHPGLHDNGSSGDLPEDQQSFPFQPSPGIQSVDDSSSTTGVDSSQDTPQETLMQKWWNWLCGTQTPVDKRTDRKARRRSRRHAHNGLDDQCPAPITVTITQTVTTTTVSGTTNSQALTANQQLRLQNASRQSTFNDWFNQNNINRPANREIESGEDD